MAEHLERQLAQLREETSAMLRLHQEGFKNCIDEWSSRHQQFLQELGALRVEGLRDATTSAAAARYVAPAPANLADSCLTSAKLGLESWVAVPAAEAMSAEPSASKNAGTERDVDGKVADTFFSEEEVSSEGMVKRTSVSWTTGAHSDETSRRRPSIATASQMVNDGVHEWKSKGTRKVLQLCVEGPIFALCSGALIFAMVILMGYETDYLAKHGGETHVAFIALQVFFNICFMFELLLRLVAHGPLRVFVHGDDRLWNLIDLALIVVFLLEFLSTLSSADGFVVFRMLRTCRLLRLTRVFKVLRMVNYVQEIRKIFLLLAASARTLLWSLLSVVFVIYIFAVFFTESTTSYFSSAQTEDAGADEQQLYSDFGTVGRSIYSLYTAVSGGRNWATFVDGLALIGWPSVAVFVGFISFFFFGVLNIVTSVFVECAMQSAQRHCEILVAEKREAELQHVKHMKAIFRMIDSDHSGTVDIRELESRLQDNRHLQDYFKALELNATDTLTLFQLLDHDDSGSLSIEEFCEGCMRLKGEARAFDINCLIQENRNAGARLLKFTKQSKARLEDLDRRLRDVSTALVSLQRTMFSSARPGGAAATSSGGGGREWDPTCWEQAPGASDDAEPGRTQ